MNKGQEFSGSVWVLNEGHVELMAGLTALRGVLCRPRASLFAS